MTFAECQAVTGFQRVFKMLFKTMLLFFGNCLQFTFVMVWWSHKRHVHLSFINWVISSNSIFFAFYISKWWISPCDYLIVEGRRTRAVWNFLGCKFGSVYVSGKLSTYPWSIKSYSLASFAPSAVFCQDAISEISASGGELICRSSCIQRITLSEGSKGLSKETKYKQYRKFKLFWRKQSYTTSDTITVLSTEEYRFPDPSRETEIGSRRDMFWKKKCLASLSLAVQSPHTVNTTKES